MSQVTIEYEGSAVTCDVADAARELRKLKRSHAKAESEREARRERAYLDAYEAMHDLIQGAYGVLDEGASRHWMLYEHNACDEYSHRWFSSHAKYAGEFRRSVRVERPEAQHAELVLGYDVVIVAAVENCAGHLLGLLLSDGTETRWHAVGAFGDQVCTVDIPARISDHITEAFSSMRRAAAAEACA